MARRAVHIQARSSIEKDSPIIERQDKDRAASCKTLNDIACGLASHSDSLLFAGGSTALCLLVAAIAFAPALGPLLFLAFVTFCLPYRLVSFVARKWTFFLVDFCYFANAACAAFLLLAPEDPRLEAALYVLCEGPLAGALLVWQCAWLHGSPNHIISVLLHQLPGLALFCHRFLAPSRQPLHLVRRMAAALATAPPRGATDPWVVTAAAGGAAAAAAVAGGSGIDGTCAASAGALGHAGVFTLLASLPGRLAAAAAVARGRVACPAVGDGVAAAPPLAAAAEVGCYALPAAPSRCPAPAWLWLVVAPLAFYAAWQLVYFLVVQVACRRLILARDYDTSYRCLARRAQRADNGLNRLVRSGGTARRLAMYGLLQLLYSVAAGALALPTYHYVALAALWQVVKLAVPVYLGACHQCQRLPAQQLRAAAAQLAAAGLLAPEALGCTTKAKATQAAAGAATVVASSRSAGASDCGMGEAGKGAAVAGEGIAPGGRRRSDQAQGSDCGELGDRAITQREQAARGA